MAVHIGLDVSLASTTICVVGEKGKIVTEAQVASTPEESSLVLTELETLTGIWTLLWGVRAQCPEPPSFRMIRSTTPDVMKTTKPRSAPVIST